MPTVTAEAITGPVAEDGTYSQASTASTNDAAVTTSQLCLSTQSGSSPRRASPSRKNSMPMAAGFPKAASSAEHAAPIARANHSVWVNVRCPLLLRGSLRPRVRLTKPCETFSTVCESARVSGPKERETVACGESRSGSSAAPAARPA